MYDSLLASVDAATFIANDASDDDEDDADDADDADDNDELVALIVLTATFDSGRLISIDAVWSIADGNNWLLSPEKWKQTENKV